MTSTIWTRLGAIALLSTASLALGSTLSAQADLRADLGSERLCRPVVPQFVTTLSSADQELEGFGLFIQFDEDGGIPYSRETFTRSPRFSSCKSSGNKCVGSRMRYEVRHEGVRHQSIRILSMGKAQKNRVIGALRWHGQAYPDQVRIACNLDEPDLRRACKLEGLEYAPNPETSGESYGKPMIGRNDRCQPKPTSITA
jgi:hypothetical protein